MAKRVIVAGAGFAGMTIAANLRQLGFDVEVFEKNDFAGGKTHRLVQQGFTFEYGALLYLFPEVINDFFGRFKTKQEDFYRLKKLDPYCRVFYGPKEYVDLTNREGEPERVFSLLEPKGMDKYNKYLKTAGHIREKYFPTAVSETHGEKTYPGIRNPRLFGQSHAKFVRSLIHNKVLRAILEFPLPYLNMGVPNTLLPFALNHEFFTNGLSHPDGGMSKLTEAVVAILDEMQVQMHLDSPVTGFDIIDNKVVGVLTHQKDLHADLFVSTMDYQYTENLLPREFRNYPESFWKNRERSSFLLVFFLGFDCTLQNLQHHNIVFEDLFEDRNKTVNYKTGRILHVCCASKTDKMAPGGMETVTVRVKVPEGIEDTGKLRELYFSQIISRMEEITGQQLNKHVIFKKSWAMSDFRMEYNSFGGSFDQSHLMKRGFLTRGLRAKNKRIGNLYYAELPGRLGPGIPSSMLNGQVVASHIYDESLKISE